MITTVEAKATVIYTCRLDDEDSQKVLDFLEKNPDYDITEAVDILYARGEIDLYNNSTESDFSTDEIISADME